MSADFEDGYGAAWSACTRDRRERVIRALPFFKFDADDPRFITWLAGFASAHEIMTRIEVCTCKHCPLHAARTEGDPIPVTCN